MIPHIPTLAEKKARTGFLEPEQFTTLLETLPDYLKAPVTLAFYTGMRRGEIISLTWDKVNLKEGFIRLEAEDTKSEQARTIYLAGEALEALREARRSRILGNPLVFHRKGKPMGDFRFSWNKACTAAGVPGLLFHDLRRTAVRNMVRAGIPERVCMQISGHKTRSVFERYNITNERDLIEAAHKLSGHVETLKPRFRHNFGHSGDSIKGLPHPSQDKTAGRYGGARGGSRTRTG